MHAMHGLIFVLAAVLSRLFGAEAMAMGTRDVLARY